MKSKNKSLLKVGVVVALSVATSLSTILPAFYSKNKNQVVSNFSTVSTYTISGNEEITIEEESLIFTNSDYEIKHIPETETVGTINDVLNNTYKHDNFQVLIDVDSVDISTQENYLHSNEIIEEISIYQVDFKNVTVQIQEKSTGDFISNIFVDVVTYSAIDISLSETTRFSYNNEKTSAPTNEILINYSYNDLNYIVDNHSIIDEVINRSFAVVVPFLDNLNYITGIPTTTNSESPIVEIKIESLTEEFKEFDIAISRESFSIK